MSSQYSRNNILLCLRSNAQYLGIDQRQRDGVRGRRGILSGVQRYDICGQRGQRSSIY